MVYFDSSGKIVYDDYPTTPDVKMKWKPGTPVPSEEALKSYLESISGLNATPDNPDVIKLIQQANGDIKPATPDIVLFNDDIVPIEIMTDLIFENIGGQELINIARSDLVNGQNVLYQPIKNLSSVYFQYNPQNILGLQDIDSNYFKKFPINFNSKVPECGTGPDCSIVYIDSETGDLVINVVNLARDEQVEVSIISDGIVIDDTIYGVIP
jgi:hypothetical protein